MGDVITFTPNSGPTTDFSGQGSKIEHPDILPIFRGSFWPGSGDFTVLAVMNALYSLVNGPYLQGLQQYGYIGPANVRTAIIDTTPLNIALPALAPGVSQQTAVDQAVCSYIDWLVSNGKIDNVDDNHDLLPVVFLDPSIPIPQILDSAGNQSQVTGANTTYNKSETLDDAIRFQYAWVTCSTNILGDVTQTLSHELVEAITDPFGTGWVQTSPTPGPNAGQVGDVCNQLAVVNGVTVVAYWSEKDCTCIVPTSGTRRLSLTQTLDTHEPHDGPEATGYVHLPIICGGDQYFPYCVRTYRNQLTVHANFQGYESPAVQYKINGQNVVLLQGTIDVDADWVAEPNSNPIFPDFHPFRSTTAQLTTWLPSTMSPELKIWVGPDAENTHFTVDVSVRETFDDPNSGGGTTLRKASMDIDLVDKEIIWGGTHDDVISNCNRLEHLSNGIGDVLGPPQPGDPPDLGNIIIQALGDQGANRSQNLINAAHLVQATRPEVASALSALAQRVR